MGEKVLCPPFPSLPFPPPLSLSLPLPPPFEPFQCQLAPALLFAFPPAVQAHKTQEELAALNRGLAHEDMLAFGLWTLLGMSGHPVLLLRTCVLRQARVRDKYTRSPPCMHEPICLCSIGRFGFLLLFLLLLLLLPLPAVAVGGGGRDCLLSGSQTSQVFDRFEALKRYQDELTQQFWNLEDAIATNRYLHQPTHPPLQS